MDTLNLGTKEVYCVELGDLLGELTSLDALNVEQKIVSEDEATTKQAWTSVLRTVGMRVDILIDTTAWTADDEGVYKLYVRVNGPVPETPVFGPFEIGVS